MNKSANRRMRRRLFEAAFRAGGLGALIIAGGTLLLLIGGVLALGFSAFTRYEVTLEAALDLVDLGRWRDEQSLRRAANNSNAIGVGVALCLEGLAYALAPGFMKRMMMQMQVTPDQTLRLAGVTALGLGVLLVALLR